MSLSFLCIGIQEKLGILHNGEVYAVFSYEAQNGDELSFNVGDRLEIVRKGDDAENEWWWARQSAAGGTETEGYVPRNLLGVSSSCVLLSFLHPLSFLLLARLYDIFILNSNIIAVVSQSNAVIIEI